MEKRNGQTGSWSQLPSELLLLFAEHLHLADIVRVSAVCGDWAWALGFVRSGWPQPQPTTTFGAITSLLEKSSPWLILPNEDGDKADYCHLFLPCENKIEDYCVQISPLPEMTDRICVGGSPDGWIATVDIWLNACILNPLTGEEFSLPSIGTLISMKPLYSQEGNGSICMVDNNKSLYGLYGNMPWERFKHRIIRKIILTSSPPHGIVFLMYGFLSHISYLVMAKIGDLVWTPVLDFKDPEYSDEDVQDCVYSHKDDKVYVVLGNGKVIAINLKHYYWGSLQLPEATVLDDLCEPEFIIGKKYVVLSFDGDLLEICREYWCQREIYDADDFWSPFVKEITVCIKVFKFDPTHYDGENSSSSWVQVTDLGDAAIFIGYNYSTCVATVDRPWLKKNSIYFAEDTLYVQTYAQGYYVREAGIYDLKNDKIERLFLQDSKFTWPPPAWFIPSHLS